MSSRPSRRFFSCGKERVRKLGGVGRSWEELGGVGRSWEELGGVGRSFVPKAFFADGSGNDFKK
jgi:hypothetical protein